MPFTARVILTKGWGAILAGLFDLGSIYGIFGQLRSCT